MRLWADLLVCKYRTITSWALCSSWIGSLTNNTILSVHDTDSCLVPRARPKEMEIRPRGWDTLIWYTTIILTLGSATSIWRTHILGWIRLDSFDVDIGANITRLLNRVRVYHLVNMTNTLYWGQHLYTHRFRHYCLRVVRVWWLDLINCCRIYACRDRVNIFGRTHCRESSNRVLLLILLKIRSVIMRLLLHCG